MELLRSWGLEPQAAERRWTSSGSALATPTLAAAAAGTPIEVGYPSRDQSAVVSPTAPACVPQDELERILEEHLGALPRRGSSAASRSRRRERRRRRPVTRAHRPAARSARATSSPPTASAAACARRSGSGPRPGAARGAPRPSCFRAPLWELVGEHRHVIYFLAGEVAAVPMGSPTAGSSRWLARGRARRDRRRARRRIRGRPASRSSRDRARLDATYAVGLAERFRDGSAFLVGDAAHRLTPRGATGMNTAIRDGYDLGWKLAWVLRGWAGEELLDSYEAERRPVAEHNGARATDPNGSIRGVADELRVDLGGRIAHVWVPGESGRVSTLDLLGDGLTLFTGPGERPRAPRRAAPPVTVRRLDAITARALGILGGASLLVRPDGVPGPQAPGGVSSSADSSCVRELMPELVVGVGEVVLDRPQCDEQRLGDLAVGLPRGGHPGHAQLARGQGVATPERVAARPAAGDDELFARTLSEAEGTVAVREVEAALELLAGRLRSPLRRRAAPRSTRAAARSSGAGERSSSATASVSVRIPTSPRSALPAARSAMPTGR